MSGKIEELVRMANQIADYFQAYPEDEAVPSIAGHIRDFWTPGMRKDMAEHLAAGGKGLKPLAARALSGLDKGQAA